MTKSIKYLSRFMFISIHIQLVPHKISYILMIVFAFSDSGFFIIIIYLLLFFLQKTLRFLKLKSTQNLFWTNEAGHLYKPL